LTDYATRADVLAFSRVAYTDFRGVSESTFNSLVDDLITRASARMERFCTRDWANHAADVSIYSVGPSNWRFVMVAGPINTLTTVETRNDPSDTWSTVDSDTYSYRNFSEAESTPRLDQSMLIKIGFGMFELGRMSRQQMTRIGSIQWKRSRVKFWRGYENLRVTSNYGYTSVPTEIEDVCIRLTDYYLQKLLRVQVAKKGDITSTEDIGSSISYPLPDDIKEDLEPWRSGSGMGVI
jgi:hypothetical protein